MRGNKLVSAALAVAGALVLGIVAGIAACAPRTPAPTTLTQTALAAAPTDSKLSKVRAGMTQVEVVEIVGKPNDERWYPSGKAWVPWYFGPDRARTAYYYVSEGRVVFSGRGDGMTVHHVEYDPSEDGLK